MKVFMITFVYIGRLKAISSMRFVLNDPGQNQSRGKFFVLALAVIDHPFTLGNDPG
jgi:hypothetical protein